MAGLEAHYSARDIEARILAALRAAGLDPAQRLSPAALGALDHFHTGGARASRELMELARIRGDDRVLDLGAGLAGPARTMTLVPSFSKRSNKSRRYGCSEPTKPVCTERASCGGVVEQYSGSTHILTNVLGNP